MTRLDPRPWLYAQWEKLHTLTDTPHAIALGFAIGVFFGFVPLVGMKTLLGVFFAWLVGCNKISAVIGVTLHDVLLPFTPFFLRVEYQLGFWLLSHPHHFPPKLRLHHRDLHTLLNWKMMLTTGGPLLVGSVVIAVPCAVLSYFLIKAATRAYRAKRLAAAPLVP